MARKQDGVVATKVQDRILKIAHIAAWSLATVIVILSLVPPVLRPQTGVPSGLEHLTIYSATGFAFGLRYGRRETLLAIFLVLFSAALESAQLFIPGRHARLSDFLIDALGACLGVIATSPVNRIRRQLL
jgi:hypothetical protein